MANISAVPLPALPQTIGQLAVRSGALPDALLRPGQTLTLIALQNSPAGQSTQVQITGRTLSAVLPTAVASGDRLQIRVGRAADGRTELQVLASRREPPTLQLPSGDRGQQLQQAARAGNLTIEPRGDLLQIAGRSYRPAELGIRPAELPNLTWTARLQVDGAQLRLVPTNDSTLALRGAAGALAVSGDPLALQAAMGLAEQADEQAGVYTETENIAPAGVPWMSLPGGATAAIEMGPERLDDESGGQARLQLWGNQLGPVAMALQTTPAGIRIAVQADAEQLERLRQAAPALSRRLQALTGAPAQIMVAPHTQRPLPPEGFERYG